MAVTTFTARTATSTNFGKGQIGLHGIGSEIKTLEDNKKALLDEAVTAVNALETAVGIGVIADPGNAGAIPVTAGGDCALTSAGAETRTLAIPTVLGQRLRLFCDTYVGDIVITVASALDAVPGSTIITMGNAGDWIELVACTVGGTLFWRVAANSGCALT
jgi:hypothetical protein